MNVSTGLLKGMKIHTPDGTRIRPTKSSVREALFNILGQELHGRSFLDLCCGSGSMGIEAASRHARPVVFVEKDRKVASITKKNLDEARRRLSEVEIRLMVESFSLFLERSQQFDYVYFDPPYDFFETHPLDKYPFDAVVKDEGWFVVEHTQYHPRVIPPRIGGLYHVRTRKYGQARLSFYQMGVPTEQPLEEETEVTELP